MLRALVTGAGGPAAISFLEAVEGELDIALCAGDIDPFAPGLYLVPGERRVILRRGDHPDFVEHLLTVCNEMDIDILVPTVDSELIPIARRSKEFAVMGIKLLMPNLACLERCLDKHRLLHVARGVVPVPESRLVPAGTPVPEVLRPMFAKPRTGSGSRGAGPATTTAELVRLCDGTVDMLVQEQLPGMEYSVDVLCSREGRVIATVPRERLKVDSGVAITARTMHHAELEAFAKRVAERVGLQGVANIQFMEDAHGLPKLLEVNPRFPGTMPLTIAAGVNMPVLAMKDLLGMEIPERYSFRRVAMTRVYRNVVVAPEQITVQEQLATSVPSCRVGLLDREVKSA